MRYYSSFKCFCSLTVDILQHRADYTRDRLSFPCKHYGVLMYNTRVNYLMRYNNLNHVANLGDEIQSLASVSWLPYVDVHVERDSLTEPFLDEFPERSIKTFMNGWYGWSNMSWPPSKSIDPITLAMHVQAPVFHKFASNESISYLNYGQPLVGARDTFTESFFLANGMTSFLSGCMTLTQYPVRQRQLEELTCDYLFVDITDNAYAQIPGHLRENKACRISHQLKGNAETVTNWRIRFIRAFEMLERYSSAKVVVTSRLHSALPASAIGATVIMVQSKILPGGGPGKNNERFSGLDEIFFTVEENSLHTRLETFDWKEPPPNPGTSLIQKFRCGIYQYLQQYHEELMDTIRFFDIHEVFDSCSLL